MMNKITMMSILGAAIWIAGCGATHPRGRSGAINPPGEAGIVATGLVLVPGVPFMTNQNVLLKSRDSSLRDYELLVGPYPKLAGEAGINLHNSVATAEITGESFGYLSGYMPITRTKRVLAGSLGTVFATRVNDTDQYDMIIVLDAKPTAPVVCELLNPATGVPTGVTRSVAKGFYVKVRTSGGVPVFDATKPIPAVGQPDPDGVLPFLDYVAARAKAAELTTSAQLNSWLSTR